MRSSKGKLACAIQQECRLCPYVNLDYDSSLVKKHKRELSILQKRGVLKGTRILRPIPSPRKVGYRTVFKFAVRNNLTKNSKKRFSLGLFQAGSHQMGPDLTICPLHVSLLRKLLKKVSHLLEKSSLSPYNEENQTGDLRYIVARTNREGSSLMITWVVTRPLREEILNLTLQLEQMGFPLEVSAMNIHSGASNAIWGKEFVLVTPKSSIKENLNHLSFEIGMSSFFQVNPWQTEKIFLRIEDVAKKIKEKDLAWDLYAGVGTISCVLAKQFQKVFSFEENSESGELITRNARENGLNGKIIPKIGLAEKKLIESVESLGVPSLIFANPSRRGIHPEARQFISDTVLKGKDTELLYLSCNVETLARDLLDFQSRGITASELQAFDMHAQTDQLEWLVSLQKYPHEK